MEAPSYSHWHSSPTPFSRFDSKVGDGGCDNSIWSCLIEGWRHSGLISPQWHMNNPLYTLLNLFITRSHFITILCSQYWRKMKKSSIDIRVMSYYCRYCRKVFDENEKIMHGTHANFATSRELISNASFEAIKMDDHNSLSMTSDYISALTFFFSLFSLIARHWFVKKFQAKTAQVRLKKAIKKK